MSYTVTKVKRHKTSVETELAKLREVVAELVEAVKDLCEGDKE